jgi:hypothetical protein
MLNPRHQLLLFNRAELIRCEPGTLAYADYLASPKWEKKKRQKRQEVKRKYGHLCCELCRNSHPRCECHHIRYDLVPHEPLTHLAYLCPECHDMIHGDKKNPLNPWYDGPSLKNPQTHAGRSLLGNRPLPSV